MTDSLPFIDKEVPDAFHGTSFAAAANILVKGFRVSKGEKHWLGTGVYFYEGSDRAAFEWARRRNPPSQVAVLRANIILGHCLNTHIPEHEELMGKYFARLEDEIKRRGLTDAGKPIKVSDSLVVEFMALNMRIDTVLAGHTVGPRQPIFPGSRFKKGHQIIMCVRNLDNIQSVRLS